MIDATSLTISLINTQVNSMPLDEEFAQKGTLQLKYSGGDDRHQYMMPSELNFSMEVSDAADLYFDHLFTGNETNYEVVLTNQDDVVLWRGYLLPEQYEEPYEHALLYVNFTATDGLARLKGKTLAPHYYDGRYSVIEFITQCLAQTNLSLDLLFAPAITNDSVLVGSDYSRILIDGNTYKSSSDKLDDCYEILTSLLETLGCTLYNFMGTWYMTGHNRFKNDAGFTNIITYYRYDSAGDFIENIDKIITPEVINLEGTPQISLIPPFQRVESVWNIDEKSNILPDDIINQPREYDLLGIPRNTPIRHWQVSKPGLGLGVARLGQRRLSNDFVDNFGLNLTADEIERRQAMVAVEENVAMYMRGLNLVDNTGYYMELEAPIYLRNEPDYIDLDLTIVSLFNYIDNSGPFPPLDEDAYGNQNLNYEILIDGVPFMSNRPDFPNRDACLLDISYEGSTFGFTSLDPKRVVGTISLKDMVLPGEGLLQVRIYALGGAANNIKGAVVGCRNLSITYTADKEHIAVLTRDIDWTTSIEVDATHGGNTADISRSHFTLATDDIDADNYTQYQVIGAQDIAVGFVPPVSVYSYKQVSQSTYNALQAAINTGNLIYGRKVNDTFYTQLKTAYPDRLSFNMFLEQNGNYYVFLEYIDGSPFTYFDLNGTIFKDDLFVYTESSQPAADRSFRQRWSRFNSGINEGFNYNRCRAQMMHDTQPAPLVRMDATVFGLMDPWILKRFDIKGFKDFVITDLTLQLDEGMSTATMVQVINDPDVVTQFEQIVEE